MRLNKINKLIVSFSAFSFLLLGSLSASDLIARGGHAAAHSEAQHAAHPLAHPATTPAYHGNYNHPAVNQGLENRGLENRAFNNGVEAGAVEGAAVNGAGINGGVYGNGVYGNGVVNPNPVYVVPTQPSVQYVTPTTTQPTVAPVTVPQQ
jgi:hypothetical protein